MVGITKIKYSIFLLVLINNYWFYFRYSMLCGSFRKNEQILTDPVTAIIIFFFYCLVVITSLKIIIFIIKVFTFVIIL